MEIGICCYGAGNPKSIHNMLKKIGRKATLCDKNDELNNYDFLIIPGVGSFDYAMKKIKDDKWDDKLKAHLNKGGNILGICLGMQILSDKSEEGKLKGLGFIPGEFKKFNSILLKKKVPHMGWNEVKYNFDFSNIDIPRYYFVHSYYYTYLNDNYVLGRTNYGIKYPTVISNLDKKVMGVQFHPEKSHKYGFDFFKSYFNYF